LRYRTFFKSIITALAALLIIGVSAGCKNGPLPTPPAPSLTASPTAAVTAEPAATTLAPLPTAALPAQTQAPAGAEALSTKSNDVLINFPDDITFSVTANGPAIIKKILLIYGSDQRSLVPETSTSEPEFTEDKEVSASWTWKMKKTGSIPPGATIWWQWEITDAADNMITTEKQSKVYRDTRFQWSVSEHPDFNIYWHDQSEAMINELLAEIQVRLARIQLDVQIPPERKPKVYIYTSSAELRDAVLFEQEWTGALAFASFNIILTAVSSDIFDWAADALPHEITHLLVGEAIFGPFGEIPTWLNEGLAQYTELKMPEYKQQALDAARVAGTLISISSLSGSFPTSGSGAVLAYAESSSIVSFLIEQYGWENMRRLLDSFKDGATVDQALMTAYSFNVDELEKKWKSNIGAK
jgi:hypothetical protein